VRPSTPDPIKTGTVELITGSNLVSNNFDVCGILQVGENPEWGPSWHFILDGFVADTKKFANLDEPTDQCKALCEADDKCIAAYLDRPLGPDFAECLIFHFSDGSLKNPWNLTCGLQQGLEFGGCAFNVNHGQAVWWVRVPDGSTPANCPAP